MWNVGGYHEYWWASRLQPDPIDSRTYAITTNDAFRCSMAEKDGGARRLVTFICVFAKETPTRVPRLKDVGVLNMRFLEDLDVGANL